MKIMILESLRYKLKNIRTYRGYNGADLLKLVFHDNSEMLRVREFAKKNDIKYVSKLNKDEIELICIYEVPDNIYSLK